MILQDERRRHPRMSTGGEYQVAFEAPDGALVQARLQNLSAGGCGIEVPMEAAAAIDAGSRLRDLRLDHPRLPLVPLEGVVVRILGKVAGKTAGYVLVGVEFTVITPFIAQLIGDHVLECLA